MQTGRMIGLMVGGIAAALLAAYGLLVMAIGRRTATLVALMAGTAILAGYRWLVRPWHLRWGATDEEVMRQLPGDELLPGAGSTTRAITIAAPPEAVWPWLVQLGYGKAGWYSYDWIDNDRQPSADRILQEHQTLAVGDRILMMPSMGFVVQTVEAPHSIVSLLEDGSTSWCLALEPTTDGSTRLLSRWRPRFGRSIGALSMLLVVEPGTFVMEQRMLRSIRDRAEAATRR
jgi:hypothetical protein